MPTQGAHIPAGNPVLSSELVERILHRLGLSDRPTLDLAGLNALYAAWSGRIPFDNLHKRIWFAGDRTLPVTGGDPVQFFENWLTFGTGGTCWPTGGAICALLQSLGFEARRVAGYMIETGLADYPGHGTVLVKIDKVDYLVDASMIAFEVLPLVPGVPASAGRSIHAINAVPTADGFDVLWHPGHLRHRPAIFRTDPAYDPVDHAFFLDGYDRSTESGPFNSGLYVCRRWPDSIATARRNEKVTVSEDGDVTVTEIAVGERAAMLIEEFGFSEEIVQALPPDDANLTE